MPQLYTALLAVICLFAGSVLHAQEPTAGAEPLVLVYQADNKWVAQEDNTSLRQLIQTARGEGFSHLQVQLPEANRSTSVQRLEVLVDILEQSLQRGVLIEEVRGSAEANTINVFLIK